jgi:putative tryptophan/tyrosine transport system substrate-binding protein
MRMRRREFIALLGGATSAWPLAAIGQVTPKTQSILWVSTEAQPDPFIASFREGMRELGYVEGQNLAFVLRYAPGDPSRLRDALPELLAVPADLIVSSGPAILAIRAAATEKPVLFAISGDPVQLGIAESLARPGKNFTGTTFMSLEVAQKRVQLLKELVPGMRRLAVLSQKNHAGEQSEQEATRAAADALSIQLAYIPFASGQEIDAALQRVAAAEANAMLVFPDGVTMVHRTKIAEFAKSHRLPSMFGWREYCDVGGFASYGGSQRATYRRLAGYADRLLRGAKPQDLPIERVTRFEFIINLKAAKTLGVDVPPTLLARADEVIE